MKFIIAGLFFSFFSLTLSAQADLRSKHFNTSKTLAIQGYDPVAYFIQNKAVKGNQQFTSSVEGITYHFSTAANRDAFNKNPKSYEPQYGGWCAYAMGAAGEKVEVDPETFKVADGKLFLFYHSWVNNTLTKWNKDEKNLHTKADGNWTKLFK